MEGTIVATKEREPTDIFHYVSTLESIKDELHFELFLINKNYTPYATRISEAVTKQISAVMVQDFMNEVQFGAGTGLAVKHISYDRNDANTLVREDLGRVGRADTVINLIEKERDSIEYFSEAEHELKRMKIALVRVTHRSNRKIKFYICRMLETSKILTTGMVWQFDEDLIDELKPAAAFSIPSKNQVVIIDQDIFAFDQPKFEKMFQYDYVRLQQADKKAELFLKKFKINVASDITGGLGNILRESNALLKKFLETDLDLMEQDQIATVADEMELELMTDESGTVIIMDKSDLNTMLDIINDNYYESQATGRHYVAKSKKSMENEG